MNEILHPAAVAILAGSGVIAVLFLPFVVLSYRRRGGLGFWRSVGWAALVVSTIALFTYTLLPLPDPDQAIRCAAPQLRPFQFVADIGTVRAQTGASLLGNAAFQQVVLNVALFAPLGALLRLLFGRGVIAAAVLGGAVSLLIETTQLTGVWGIYDCAYRLFDVDDLIANTAGAVLGSVAAIVVLAGRRPAAPRRGPVAVTRTRRLAGMLVDVVVVTIAGSVSAVVVGVAGEAIWGDLLAGGDRSAGMVVPQGVLDGIAFAVPFALHLAVVLGSGATIGEHAVALRVVPGARPAAVSRPLRFLAGIGGWMLLDAATTPIAGPVLAAFVIASVAVVLFGPGRVGLASLVAGTGVEDARGRQVVASAVD